MSLGENFSCCGQGGATGKVVCQMAACCSLVTHLQSKVLYRDAHKAPQLTNYLSHGCVKWKWASSYAHLGAHNPGTLSGAAGEGAGQDSGKAGGSMGLEVEGQVPGHVSLQLQLLCLYNRIFPEGINPISHLFRSKNMGNLYFPYVFEIQLAQ